MRRFSFTFVLVLSTLLLVTIVSAQQAPTTTVPNLIRYSGTLKDALGAPLVTTTPLGIIFAIYNQQEGGAAVWQETQNVTPDGNGQYSVLLGSTTAAGLPDDLFSQQEQRWLGVQIQGEAEQARVLMVSVPYAFKAHEAETLGGKSVSDFMLATNGGSSGNGANTSAPSSLSSNPNSTGIGRTDTGSSGPTNFTGSTTNQIVSVTQSGTGAGLKASAPTLGISGTATAPSGTAYGVQGVATGTAGVGLIGTATSTTGFTYGLRGTSSSTSGTGVRGIDTATSGVTTGVSSYVASAAGIAGAFNNEAGGKILSGQNNGVEKFSVDGLGNVNSLAGTYQIAGGSVVSIGTLTDGNLFLGAGAGSQNVAGSGQLNTFSGYQAGYGNTTGQENTFVGDFAGRNNGTASYNTFTGTGAGEANSGDYNAFFGYEAGLVNTSGGSDTFYGSFAGYSNTTACCNVFTGYKSGYSTTDGGFNVFSGWKAGYSNILGKNNIFEGYQAGYSNTGDSAGDGSGSAFFGYQAGFSNTLGYYNTFSGSQAGYSNTLGYYNTFSGYLAGYSNTLGYYNTFSGYEAGYFNTGDGAGNGSYNTFFGAQAGLGTTSGSGNTFLGVGAGANNTTGSGNVYIDDSGPIPGTESSTIRIGGGLAAAAYIGGIYGSTSSSGIPVYINSNGQLGTLTSSRRFKEQIADMGDTTSALMKLRPVTFFYKRQYDDGERTLQYGLIAEEVARVYPELVDYDKDGQPYSVRYQYLSTMLLNEAQKQYRRAKEQTKLIESQQQEIESLKQQLQLQNATLQERLSRLEKLVETQTVAQK